MTNCFFREVASRVLILFLILLSVIAPALVAIGQKAVVQSTPAQIQTLPDTASQKDLLSEMQRLDDRLLSTVYWALGVVVLMAVLLTGFSWYTNFRVYERDRSSLRDELRVFVSQEMENTRQQLRDRFEQEQKAIENRFTEVFGNFNAHASKMNSSVTESTNALEERVDSRFSKMMYDFLNLKIRVEEIDKTVPSNRLRTYVSLLHLVVEFGWSWSYVDALKEMEELMGQGATISSSDVPRLNSSLAKIPQDFSGLVDNIRKLITTHTSAH